MKLNGVSETERVLFVAEECDHYGAVELTVLPDEPIFLVEMSSEEDVCWVFYYTKTNYEIVKMCIMDVVEDCECVADLGPYLDEVFLGCFEEIMLNIDDECDCICECCSERLN